MKLNEVFSPLNEEPVDIRQSSELVDSLEPYKKHIEAYFANPDGFILRGIRNDENFFVSNGERLDRKSAYTRSYVNTIVDQMPEWKAYPKRSKSFVGTTNKHKADRYGTHFFMIPLENQAIGICPDSDFWFGFSKDTHNENVDMMNLMIADMWAFNRGSARYDRNDAPDFLKPTELRQLFETFDEDHRFVDEDERPDEYFSEEYKNLGMEMMNYPGSSLEFFREKLDPVANNFVLSKDVSVSKYPDNEVWMSGEVLFIKTNYAKEQGWIR